MESFKKRFPKVLHQLQKKKTEWNVVASDYRYNGTRESNEDTSGLALWIEDFRQILLDSHLGKTCVKYTGTNP